MSELVLLHGMGASRGVWWPLDATHGMPAWFMASIAVDLPGHGERPLGEASFSAMADAVEHVVAAAGDVTILGHSLGGVIALELACRYPQVRRVVALGVKVEWTDEELAAAATAAAKPPRVFDTPHEAMERAVALAGLGGPARPPMAFLRGCIQDVGTGWRSTFDPRALAVGRPDMARLVADAHGDVVLARGELDPMQTHEQLVALVGEDRAVTLPGLGHSAHVEAPEAVAALLR